MDKKKPFKQAPKKAVSQQPKAITPKRDYTLLLLWIVILVISAIRYRLIAVPFERDEGEYGYIGNLFLHGVAPFKDAYSMKLPGTSFMYAVLMFFFGHTNTGVHLGMIFINVATMYFLFAGFKKLYNPLVGLATASIFGLMAISYVFDGFAAHATQFICFYSSIGLFFLVEYIKSGKVRQIFLCGLMFGMAFLMKQQAVFLILFGAILLFVYLKIEKKQKLIDTIKKLFMYGTGVFIPYIIVLLIVLFAGEFKVFWLWTIQYASTYESVKSLDMIITLFNLSFIPAWGCFYYLFLLALGGILVLFWTPYTRLQKIFTLLYFIASLLVLSSGFYFRQHYFVVILPAVGLLSGIFLDFVIKKIKVIKSPSFSTVILVGIVLFTIYNNHDYYFKYSPRMVCDMSYWGNPFNATQEIAKYIKDNTKDTDKIAVLGSEPEICFYADRTSASGFLYTYPLVEIQPYNEIMQEQMIKEIEKNKPPFLVFCNVAFSWLAQKGSPTTVMNWANKYIQANYTPVGFADFFNNRGWHIYWGDDSKNRLPNPESVIYILKRNPGM